jgi:hypothetical protein
MTVPGCWIPKMKNNPMQSIGAATIILRFQAGLRAAV